MTPVEKVRRVYYKKRNGDVIVPADEVALLSEQLRWLSEILGAVCNEADKEEADASAYCFEQAKREKP